MKSTSCLVFLSLLCAAVVVSSYPVRDEGSCARRRHREQHRHDEYEQYGYDGHDEHEGYGHDGPYAELKKSDTAAQDAPKTSGDKQTDVAPAKQPSTEAQVIVEPAAASKPAYDMYGEHHESLQEKIWSVTQKPRIPYRPPTGIGGILFPDQHQLREDGEMCTVDYACCSNQCYNGACCTDLKELNGRYCHKATDCCSGICQDNTCCAAGKFAVGATCTVSTDCCSNNCITRTAGTTICCPPDKLALGAACHHDHQCCGGLCGPLNTCV